MMIDVVLELHWSNNPIPINELIEEPDFVFDVPLGLFTSLEQRYPDLTDNAGKVLAVNENGTDVEWVNATTGGGINVIEYVPSLHEVILSAVANTDFIPTPASAADTTDSANWNAVTGVMSIANPTGNPFTYEGIATEYVGLKLPISLVGMRGQFTLDSSQCEDAWGMGLLSRSQQIFDQVGIEGIDLYTYLEQQHFKNTVGGGFDLSKPQTIGTFLEDSDEYSMHSWANNPFNTVYAHVTRSSTPEKPQGTYTFTLGSIVDAYMAMSGMTEEQVIASFQSVFTESELALTLTRTWVFCAELEAFLEVKADTPFLHFFMTAYHKESDPVGTYELNPASQITLTFDLEEVGNTVPVEAVDGDFLHVLANARLLNKVVPQSSFVQLYDNQTKMIVHANQG